jgi:UDP-glucose 4-epimerase
MTNAANPVKAVVTGGAGFIGSHLADRLVELGYQVTVLDDLSTGRVENIAHPEGHPRFRFVQGSILDKDLLKSLFEGVTYVFRQAAIPSLPRSFAVTAMSLAGAHSNGET